MMNTATTERIRIELMFDRAEGLRDYPGSYFPARIKARAALAAWTAQYPAEAQAEADERAKRSAENEARKQLEYEQSFIGRGID